MSKRIFRENIPLLMYNYDTDDDERWRMIGISDFCGEMSDFQVWTKNENLY